MSYYFMFNKPGDCICARRDERHKTVFEYFPKELHNVLFNVGRLDKDTEGFLIMTDDGILCHDLMMPECKVPKTYFFHALSTHGRALDENRLSELECGINIYKDRDFVTAPAELEILGTGKLSDIKDILPEGERKMSERRAAMPIITGCLTITEGKKHQVKRMLRYAGYRVVYLKRMSIGGVELDPALPLGKYRALTDVELSELKSKTAE